MLVEALSETGYSVSTEYWGRRRDDESLFAKVRGRLADLARVRRRLHQERFDVLLVQTSHDWMTLIRDVPLLIGVRRRRLRIVIQSHGSMAGWITGSGHSMFKLWSRAVFGLSDAHIFSSSAEAEAFRGFAPHHRFYVADNMFSVPEETATVAEPAPRWGIPSGVPTLFFAARMIPEKGILDLLDAMPEILRRVECHLMVAGGLGPLEEVVKARLASPELAAHASWLGYLDRTNLRCALKLADVYVLPTYHTEGFPQMVQEALGHGVPVITVATRGLADHLVDGVHGHLIPARDRKALVDAVVSILSNPELRARMSASCLEKSREFRPEAVVRQYDLVIHDVLER